MRGRYCWSLAAPLQTLIALQILSNIPLSSSLGSCSSSPSTLLHASLEPGDAPRLHARSIGGAEGRRVLALPTFRGLDRKGVRLGGVCVLRISGGSGGEGRAGEEAGLEGGRDGEGFARGVEVLRGSGWWGWSLGGLKRRAVASVVMPLAEWCFNRWKGFKEFFWDAAALSIEGTMAYTQYGFIGFLGWLRKEWMEDETGEEEEEEDGDEVEVGGGEGGLQLRDEWKEKMRREGWTERDVLVELAHRRQEKVRRLLRVRNGGARSRRMRARRKAGR